MKKLLFTIVCMLSFFGMANAQMILSDETKSDGLRIITGKEIGISGNVGDKHVFSISLSYMESDNFKGRYSFDVRTVRNYAGYAIDKSMSLLLKNVDGDVIELKASSDFDATVRHISTIGNSVLHNYYVTAMYDVTEEQIEKLCKGIIKIKQEYQGGTFEKEYKKDKVAKKLTQEYNEIKEASKKKKSFSDGF